MIARIWTGTTRAQDEAEYLAYLQQTGVRECRSTPGNRGVFIFQQPVAEGTRFMFLSLWEDEASIRAFAGDDITRAVYYPEDRSYLLALAPTVEHYEAHSFG
jgi:heme-degrading monooxygenase HmoA